MASQYDVIVIGSGIGGLAAAVLLAKVFKRRVCVLEQHWVPGGQTHSFSRSGGAHEWDVGIHYVGDVTAPTPVAHLLRFLADDRLRWRPLATSYDQIRFRDCHFDFIAGRDAFKASLCDRFPAETEAIHGYFADLNRATGWSVMEHLSWIIPRLPGALMRRCNRRGAALTQQTTADYMRRRFASQSLRNLLVSQWGDYGLHPELSAFEIHALVSNSYMNGGWYPEGGAKRIAEVLVCELEKHGGRCLTNTKVERIHTQGRRVTAVDISSGHHGVTPTSEQLPVTTLISDAGAFNTYRRLLDTPCFEELETLDWQSSMTMLFFTLDCDPRELGFEAANYWLHDSTVETPFETGFQRGAFLSFPGLKRGGEPPSRCGELLTMAEHDRFARWQTTRWKRRGEDYLTYKRQLAEELVSFAGSFFPELPAHIEGSELATPLSLQFFTQHTRGNPYGVPFVPGRHRYPFCRPTTPFANLFLAGQDAFCLGFLGALVGGALAATRSQGVNAMLPVLWAVARDVRRRKTNHGTI